MWLSVVLFVTSNIGGQELLVVPKCPYVHEGLPLEKKGIDSLDSAPRPRDDPFLINKSGQYSR